MTKSNCRCHHPTFSNGSGARCHYRTCTHEETNHFGSTSASTSTGLDEEIGILLSRNVEGQIKDTEHLIISLIIGYVNSGKLSCGCGAPMKREQLRYFRSNSEDDPKEGVAIPNEELRVWLFNHCPYCGYDTNYKKIMQRGGQL